MYYNKKSHDLLVQFVNNRCLIVLVRSKLLIRLYVVESVSCLVYSFVNHVVGTSPSHVFVCLCKDYVIVFVQIVDVGCELLSDVEVLWIEKGLEVCRF